MKLKQMHINLSIQLWKTNKTKTNKFYRKKNIKDKKFKYTNYNIYTNLQENKNIKKTDIKP